MPLQYSICGSDLRCTVTGLDDSLQPHFGETEQIDFLVSKLKALNGRGRLITMQRSYELFRSNG